MDRSSSAGRMRALPGLVFRADRRPRRLQVGGGSANRFSRALNTVRRILRPPPLRGKTPEPRADGTASGVHKPMFRSSGSPSRRDKAALKPRIPAGRIMRRRTDLADSPGRCRSRRPWCASGRRRHTTIAATHRLRAAHRHRAIAVVAAEAVRAAVAVAVAAATEDKAPNRQIAETR